MQMGFLNTKPWEHIACRSCFLQRTLGSQSKAGQIAKNAAKLTASVTGGPLTPWMITSCDVTLSIAVLTVYFQLYGFKILLAYVLP